MSAGNPRRHGDPAVELADEARPGGRCCPRIWRCCPPRAWGRAAPTHGRHPDRQVADQPPGAVSGKDAGPWSPAPTPGLQVGSDAPRLVGHLRPGEVAQLSSADGLGQHDALCAAPLPVDRRWRARLSADIGAMTTPRCWSCFARSLVAKSLPASDFVATCLTTMRRFRFADQRKSR